MSLLQEIGMANASVQQSFFDILQTKPVMPDIPDIQNPADPSTWQGIPDNITVDEALDALTCVEMYYGDSMPSSQNPQQY